MKPQFLKDLAGPLYYRLRPLPPHPDPAIFGPESDFEQPGATKQVIVIASTPRSGSNLLGYMLREHGGFGYPLEYLSYVDLPYWSKRFGTARMDRLMRHFMKRRTSPNGNFVIKAHWHQFAEHLDHLASLTNGLGVKRFVWLYRPSLIDQAISWAIADQTNVWISGTKPRQQAVYKYEEIVRFATYVEEENANWQAYLRRCHLGNSIAVDYDSVIDPPNPTTAALREFLDLDADLTPSRRTRRQSTTINQEWKERFIGEAGPSDRWIVEPREWSL